jgi:hypothetical protein
MPERRIFNYAYLVMKKTRTSFERSRPEKSRARASLALCLALVAALAAPSATAVGTGTTTAHVAGNPASGVGFNCGYDPQGAEREWHNHRANLLALNGRASGGRASQSVRTRAARTEDRGDLALIEDDGTIIMSPSKFDLKNRAVMFTPDGDGYRIAREEVDFEKEFGFKMNYFYGSNGDLLGSSDNGWRDMALIGSGFTFFGVLYDRIYVGSNGYITFTRGDTGADPSVAALASELPRIAPLWSNLNPTTRGGVYYNRLSGRHVITWDRVPHAQFGGANTAQAVLYDDGRIAFVYKKVKTRSAVAGISPGRPDLEALPVDLSDPPEEAVTGPFFESFSTFKRLDVPALTRAFYEAHGDIFDALYIWTDFSFDNGPGFAHSFNVRNDIGGIGIPMFDRGGIFGSASRLSTVITMGNVADGQWPADPDEHVVGLNSAISIVCHEQGHRWLSYVRFDADHDIKDDLLGRDNAHWSFLVDTRTNPEGSFSSLMEGNAWRDNGNGTFTSIETAVNHFNDLDLYLMGLIPPDEVGDITYLTVDPALKPFLREGSPRNGFSLSAQRKTATVDQIILREGKRAPDAESAPKVFRIAFILLTESGRAPADATLEKLDRYRRSLIRYFSTATSRLGSLDSRLTDDQAPSGVRGKIR